MKTQIERIMSEQALKDVIQQKYGEAATRAAQGKEKGGCCGTSCGCGDPITSNLYGDEETGSLPAEAVAASLGCGNPTALIELQAGRDRARSRVGWRHRRAALGKARRTDRQGLRPRHDRRDARPGARKPAQGRRDQRRVPQGRDRAHPAARRQRGRDHLELRDQPVRRQGAACSARPSAC